MIIIIIIFIVFIIIIFIFYILLSLQLSLSSLLSSLLSSTFFTPGEPPGVQGLLAGGGRGGLDLGLPVVLRLPGVQCGGQLLAEQVDGGRVAPERLHSRPRGPQARQPLLPGHLRSDGRLPVYVCMFSWGVVWVGVGAHCVSVCVFFVCVCVCKS